MLTHGSLHTDGHLTLTTPEADGCHGSCVGLWWGCPAVGGPASPHCHPQPTAPSFLAAGEAVMAAAEGSMAGRVRQTDTRVRTILLSDTISGCSSLSSYLVYHFPDHYHYGKWGNWWCLLCKTRSLLLLLLLVEYIYFLSNDINQESPLICPTTQVYMFVVLYPWLAVGT